MSLMTYTGNFYAYQNIPAHVGARVGFMLQLTSGGHPPEHSECL